jgi:mannose-6-phosphate isomerase-like protein (cupin superfamily)
VEYKKVVDGSTVLSIFEKLPFQPKRVYYMQGMDYFDVRGKHQHKKNRQVLICILGDCTITVKGIDKDIYQNGYILLEPSDWHIMKNFSDDCVLLILASEEYNPDDYIR